MNKSQKLVDSIIKGIQDKKGRKITHIDLSGNEKPVSCIGLGLAQWVAIDFVDVMVHIFLPETREFYDLEHLWEDAKLTRIPDLD